MYGKPKEFTIEEILKKVSEWDLWNYYIPGISLGKAFCNPLRNDKNPSASLFVARNGALLMKDFAGTTMNIWMFLQAKYGLTFYESLVTVNNDFNLKLLNKPKISFPTMEIFGITTNKKLEPQEASVIKIKKRIWNEVDEAYWGQYGLSIEFLIEHKVLALQNYWLNDKLFYWYSKNNPMYSYEFGYSKRKLYAPLAKKYKFITNAGDSILQGYEYLPKEADILIITKSYKDVLVLKKLGFSSFAPQSESMNIPEKVITSIKLRFKAIYLLYDNDATGIKFSKKICDAHGFVPIFIPKPVKDVSDYRKKHGEKNTLNMLTVLL